MQHSKAQHNTVKRLARSIVAVCLAFAALSSVVSARTDNTATLPVDFDQLTPGSYAPNELIVGVHSRFPLPATARALTQIGAIVDGIPALGAYRVVLAPHIPMREAAAWIATLPGVRYVEPNYY
ncbi:MAG: hypothetical protein NZ874_08060, partial [Fimbriimonadales bacterium]|nr:hypothetical protein [Fimbriimonadales bacterium]